MKENLPNNQIFSFYNIKTKEDLLILLNHEKWQSIKRIIRFSNSHLRKIIFNLFNIKSLEDFELFLNHTNFNDFKYLLSIADLKEDLEVLESFEYFIKKCNIQNNTDLINFMKNGKWEHIKKSIKNNSINTLNKIIQLKQDKSNTNNINIKNTFKSIDACSDNESDNYDILHNKNKNYKLIEINNKIIGIIKEIGERSFLSFQDVFDRNGNLIFMKGWIYNILIDDTEIKLTEIFKNQNKLDLSNISGLKRNPIRKISKNNFETLYENFDKLVEIFIYQNNI